MLKNQTAIFENDTNAEWRIERRTRGQERPDASGAMRPTWVVILQNRAGERRFVPEARLFETYRLAESTA